MVVSNMGALRGAGERLERQDSAGGGLRGKAGRIAFASAPGSAPTASLLFDVPIRFYTDRNRWMPCRPRSQPMFRPALRRCADAGRVDRCDDVGMGFIDFDNDLYFDAVVHKTASGFAATAVTRCLARRDFASQ
jgi:hypothetical protein